MRYAIVIEKGENSYGAYVPDLPGCFAVGETVEELRELIKGSGFPIPSKGFLYISLIN